MLLFERPETDGQSSQFLKCEFKYIMFGSGLFGMKNRGSKMKRFFFIGILGFILLTSQVWGAEKKATDTLNIQSEIQTVLSGLSDNLNRFEHLQKMLESTGKDNKS